MMLITYSNGWVQEGIVLSFGEGMVRVAVKDSDDAAEFRLINGRWVSEDCEVVRLQFAGAAATVPVVGDDFLDAMFTAAAPPTPAQRVM